MRLWPGHLPLPPVPLAAPGECDVCDIPAKAEGAHAACLCGATSAHLPTRTGRRRWHREHRRLGRTATRLQRRARRRKEWDDLDPELLTW